MKLPFFGPSDYSDSPNLSAEDTLNLIPEVADSKTGKSVGMLRNTPGLTLFTTLPTQPLRGVWCGEGRLFAASGARAYEVYIDSSNGSIAASIDLGSIGDDTDHTPVQIFFNGTQTMWISAGLVYVHNGITMAQPVWDPPAYTDLVISATDATVISSAAIPFDQTDKGRLLSISGGTGFTVASYTITSIDRDGNATLSSAAGTTGSTGGTATESGLPVTARSGAYIDTYGVVAPAPSGSPGDAAYETGNNFYISAPGNFLSWNKIDVAAKEGYPDHILALIADHEELFLFGDLQSTEVWRDTGNADFPFQRDMGAFMHFGLAAQNSVVQLGFNGIAWLAWSSGRGDVQAVYAQGFVPQRISTHAVETAWRQYSEVEDAIAYSYIEDGHNFWVLHFPSADATWVYDLTASQQIGMPMWHRRGWTDPATGILHCQRQRFHTFGYLKNATGGIWTDAPVHFVGDWKTGNIYVQSLAYEDDAGDRITRQRACSHVSNENLRYFWARFQLDCEVGTGSEDLVVTLDYSRDYGHTFVNASTRTAASGNFTSRLIWNRLGYARDIVFRITITTRSKIMLLNGYASGEPGNN